MKLFLEVVEVKKDLEKMDGKPPSMISVEITDDEDGRTKLVELQADPANKTLFENEHIVRVHECREGSPCTVRDLAIEGIVSRNSDTISNDIDYKIKTLEDSVSAIYNKQVEAVKVIGLESATMPKDFIVRDGNLSTQTI